MLNPHSVDFSHTALATRLPGYVENEITLAAPVAHANTEAVNARHTPLRRLRQNRPVPAAALKWESENASGRRSGCQPCASRESARDCGNDGRNALPRHTLKSCPPSIADSA